TLDFGDDKILTNYRELFSLEVQPVIPYSQIEMINDIIKIEGLPEWLFIGRLVPLMRKGGGYANRLFSVLDSIKNYIKSLNVPKKMKLWALGVGAPSLISQLVTKVDGLDSARWRITASNMVLLPKGGERGVGNLTKWRGTHHRIGEGLEKELVIKILQQIDYKSGGLEILDKSLGADRFPKQLTNKIERDLPTIGNLLTKLRDEEELISIYDLELILRTSGNLRLMFNYWTALSFKTNILDINQVRETVPTILDSIFDDMKD
ncbi:MAG: hypothetical protein ACXACR_16480, partial [Candidatus Hodarchaeales archaeon]